MIVMADSGFQVTTGSGTPQMIWVERVESQLTVKKFQTVNCQDFTIYFGFVNPSHVIWLNKQAILNIFQQFPISTMKYGTETQASNPPVISF